MAFFGLPFQGLCALAIDRRPSGANTMPSTGVKTYEARGGASRSCIESYAASFVNQQTARFAWQRWHEDRSVATFFLTVLTNGERPA